VTNSCEHGIKKPSCSIKSGEFHYYLRAVLAHEERRFFMELGSFYPLIEG
jgi:hypothetical protein